MSPQDMCLMATSDEASGSYWFQPLAGDLCGPLCYCGPARSATTAAYASPPTLGPSCRLLLGASSPVELWAMGPSRNRFPDSLVQDSSWRAQTSCLGWKTHQLSFCLRGAAQLREDIASLTIPLRHARAKALVALALVPTRVFFLPAATAFVSSQRKNGGSSMLDVGLKNASYSFISIKATAGTDLPLKCSS